MNKFCFFLLVSCLTLGKASLTYAQLDYFVPDGTTFNPDVPTPESILGYQIGEWHTRIDLMVTYMKALAESSDRTSFQVIGYTNEMRPQIVLTITDPSNHQSLELIRTTHLRLADPTSSISDSDYDSMPSVVLMGYNVHGNEPSSTEAAMLTAYYLTAGMGSEVERWLKEAVIFVDPAFNPDGRDRHSTWVNSHKGAPPVSDPADREHNEAWPRGRTNHYWFDLNRDWLPLTQIESQNRVKFYHQWLPNVVTDFHEMGTNATYFFEPTEPFGSENPAVPRSNYDQLNNLFARYYEKALNEIGSLYFTKEVFDNSYPGYGSTYPDIHGGLGMVFEQASSRGHVQSSNTRDIEFRFTIRNHFRTSLATVEASVENRQVLLRHQKEFFESAVREAGTSEIKGYVFKSHDKSREKAFVDLLLAHRIKTFHLGGTLTIAGTSFVQGQAYVVPTNQPQYRMVRTMFEEVKSFHDSVFYDASTWNMGLAYGMKYAAVRATRFQAGPEVSPEGVSVSAPEPSASDYAWLVSWEDYYAPKALFNILKEGVFVKMAMKPFSATVGVAVMQFNPGTLMIPLYDQKLDPETVTQVIRAASKESGVEFHSVSTGMSVSGIDLGSNNFRTVDLPRVFMLVGDGVSGTEAGEIWFLLDSKIGLPITKVDVDDFTRLDIRDYDVLLMVSGGYSSLGESGAKKIQDWVLSGGTLYAQRTAVNWVIQNKLTQAELENFESEEAIERRNYIDAGEYFGSRRIGGSVFLADVDNTHPLAFGIDDLQIPVYRNHSIFMKAPKDPYSSLIRYASSPHIAGYVHPENLSKLQNRTATIAERKGQGHIILQTDNPNFRAYWYGTSKFLFNSIFFGSLY